MEIHERSRETKKVGMIEPRTSRMQENGFTSLLFEGSWCVLHADLERVLEMVRRKLEWCYSL